MKRLITSLDTDIFNDSVKRMDSIPHELEGTSFFQLSWNDVSETSISVSCNKNCVVIIVAWENESRLDNSTRMLNDQGWVLRRKEQITWRRGLNEFVYGKSKGIFTKRIPANSDIMFNRPENGLPISIFVVQGTIKFFNC